MTRREADVKQDVLHTLGSDPDFIVWNHPTGTFFTREGHAVKAGRPGSMDVIGCYRLVVTPDMIGREIGVAIGIETKHPKTGGQREIQKKFQKAWEMRGGVYVLTRTADDIKQLIIERILQ